METERPNGQYGKRNPSFLYQAETGYSIRAPVACGGAARGYPDEPPQSGVKRCGEQE